MAGAADMPFTYSVELRPSDSEAKRFQMAFDPDAQLQALRLAVDIASERYTGGTQVRCQVVSGAILQPGSLYRLFKPHRTLWMVGSKVCPN